jgi:hypothetical protein
MHGDCGPWTPAFAGVTHVTRRPRDARGIRAMSFSLILRRAEGPSRRRGAARRKAQTYGVRLLRDGGHLPARHACAHFCALPRFALLERLLGCA